MNIKLAIAVINKPNKMSGGSIKCLKLQEKFTSSQIKLGMFRNREDRCYIKNALRLAAKGKVAD